MTTLLKDKKSITDWLDIYGVKNYKLREDTQYGFVVDIEGDVDLYMKKLSHIPIQFGSVSGYFDCSGNQLTSLEGGPTSAGKKFDCHSNQLTSLLGCPTSIGGDFYCHDNESLGEYQEVTDFKIIKEKLLSDTEKKLLSTSLSDNRLIGAVLKL